jgi:malate dehydrogenase (oxaloacetate-decarboxylating)
MFPVVYTPTEADAIAEYSHLFRRSEGLYLTPEWEDGMEEDFLDACEGRDLDLVRLHFIRRGLMIDRRF